MSQPVIVASVLEAGHARLGEELADLTATSEPVRASCRPDHGIGSGRKCDQGPLRFVTARQPCVEFGTAQIPAVVPAYEGERPIPHFAPRLPGLPVVRVRRGRHSALRPWG
jgi:hypothetical protein